MSESAAELSTKLRVPFPPEHVGKLPRVTCRDCSKGTCTKHSKSKCAECGNWISTQHIHLDFVGHAHVTDRLLSVDPEWSWEPVAFAEDGTPRVVVRDGEAVLWVKLTVGGVTRYGVGVCAANKDEREKQLISDAIRNASMRFGVALDLWAKGDLPGLEDHGPPARPETPPSRAERAADSPLRAEPVEPDEPFDQPALTLVEEDVPHAYAALSAPGQVRVDDFMAQRGMTWREYDPKLLRAFIDSVAKHDRATVSS